MLMPENVFLAFIQSNEIQRGITASKTIGYSFGDSVYSKIDLMKTPEFDGFRDGYLRREQVCYADSLELFSTGPVDVDEDDYDLDNTSSIYGNLFMIFDSMGRQERYDSQYKKGMQRLETLEERF